MIFTFKIYCLKYNLDAMFSAEQIDDDGKEEEWKLLVIILSVAASVILILGITFYFQKKRIFRTAGKFFH